jgi:ubiquitin-protein ligase
MFKPSRCQFLTKVYHPNIGICLDVLKGPPKGSWNPATSIATMLFSLRVLPANPSPDDPLLVNIVSEEDVSFSSLPWLRAFSCAVFTNPNFIRP